MLTAGLMVGLAVLFDSLQFGATFLIVLPVVGWAAAVVIPLVITLFAFIIFGVWLTLSKVNFFKGKQAVMKIITLLSSFVMEIIPFLESVPGITGGVITMIMVTAKEDKDEKDGAVPAGVMKGAGNKVTVAAAVSPPAGRAAIAEAEAAIRARQASSGRGAVNDNAPPGQKKQNVNQIENFSPTFAPLSGPSDGYNQFSKTANDNEVRDRKPYAQDNRAA